MPYRPPWHWHCFGFVAWLLTVGAVVHPSASTAYVIGECTGALVFPVLLRVGYVVVFARGPYMGNRALLSPWIWAIAIAVNAMAASGHHPH